MLQKCGSSVGGMWSLLPGWRAIRGIEPLGPSHGHIGKESKLAGGYVCRTLITQTFIKGNLPKIPFIIFEVCKVNEGKMPFW